MDSIFHLDMKNHMDMLGKPFQVDVTHSMYKMVQPYSQPKKGKINPNAMVKMKVGSFVRDLAVQKQLPLVYCNRSKLIIQGNCIILELHTNPVATKNT